MYSNPCAPQWAYPDWGVSPYCESDFTYTFPLTVPITGLVNQPLAFGFDSTFAVVEWDLFAVNQDAADLFEVRLTDDKGKRRINNFIQVADARGFVPAPWFIAPGGVQRIDIKNLSGGEHAVWVKFRGRKRFQNVGCVAPPPGFAQIEYIPLWARYSVAPPGYEDEPYVYSFPLWDLTAPVDSLVEGVPLALDTDAGFLARSVVMHVLNTDASTLWSARLVDPSGKRGALQINPGSSVLPYQLDLNFGGDLTIATSGRKIYPEMSCPAGSVMAVDLRLLGVNGTSTGIIRIQGVKRHKK